LDTVGDGGLRNVQQEGQARAGRGAAAEVRQGNRAVLSAGRDDVVTRPDPGVVRNDGRGWGWRWASGVVLPPAADDPERDENQRYAKIATSHVVTTSNRQCVVRGGEGGNPLAVPLESVARHAALILFSI